MCGSYHVAMCTEGHNHWRNLPLKDVTRLWVGSGDSCVHAGGVRGWRFCDQTDDNRRTSEGGSTPVVLER
eukprot:m.176151 g.176151  ORF g.176151 m.176151 type:complete len:70 (+) comp24431_c0_seq2:1053-1262(+)